MAAEDIVINNIARTSIQIDELAVPNRTGGDNAGLDDALMDADDKSFGGYKPVVFINGYYVEKYLDYFDINILEHPEYFYILFDKIPIEGTDLRISINCFFIISFSFFVNSFVADFCIKETNSLLSFNSEINLSLFLPKIRIHRFEKP